MKKKQNYCRTIIKKNEKNGKKAVDKIMYSIYDSNVISV